MATTIAEFLASVGFKTDEKSMKAALTKVAGFGAAVSVAAGAAIAGIMRVAQGEVDLAKQAESLGVPIRKLEELGYVAEQSGAGAEAVAAALGSLKDKYPHIKDASVLLERVGRAMRGMSEQAARLYAKRMGIDPALVPMLTRDVSALKDEYAAMYAVAGRDAQTAAADSKALMAELGKLRTMSELLAKAVGGAFIGKIRGDIEALRRAVMENFAKIKRIFEVVIGLVLRIAGVVGAFVRRVVAWASALVGWYDKLDDGQKRLVQGLALFLAAWKLLNAGFLATPLGAIVTALTTIVGLIDDYCTYMEGGTSHLDWGPWVGPIEAVRKAIGDAVNAVVRFCRENEGLFTALGTGIGVAMALKGAFMAIQGVLGGVTLAFKVLWGILKANPLGIIITLAALVIEYWEPIKEFFGHLWDGFADRFPNVVAWAKGAAKAIEDFFAPAVDWIKGKLKSMASILPDFVRKKIGLGDDAAAAPPAVPEGAALKPSPMQAQAAINNKSVKVESKAEITVNGAQNPEQVAGKVAAAQNGVAADIARNTQGAVR